MNLFQQHQVKMSGLNLLLMIYSVKNIHTSADLTSAKYINEGLLSYTQKFTPDTDYIFFAFLLT